MDRAACQVGNHGQDLAFPSTSGAPEQLKPQLLWRSFTTDVLTCATCGSRRNVLALVQDPSSIQAILSHLGLASQQPAPPVRPRGPPQGSLDLSSTT